LWLVLVIQHYYGDKIEENELGEASGTWGRREKKYKQWHFAELHAL
jgi:hypothetical protein